MAQKLNYPQLAYENGSVMQNRKLILVIDNEIRICQLLCEILEEQNYKVLYCSNVYGIRSLLLKHKIDLVILDLHMPGMDGLDIINLIRDFDKNLPVIILSAFTINPDIKQNIEKITFVILDKPIEPSQLILYIRKALYYKI